MPDGLTTVTVTTSDSDAPDATALGRTWVIPHASTEAFVQALTESFGEPVHEAIAMVADLVASAGASEQDVHITRAPGVGDA